MKTLTAILLALIALAPCLRADPRDLEVNIPTSIAGGNYVFRIPLGTLYASPPWKSLDDAPPLAPGKAASLAKAQMQQLFPQVQHWSLDAITLRRIKDDTRWGHWIYMVQFHTDPDGSGIKSAPVEVPVLMDGSTVAPTAAKE